MEITTAHENVFFLYITLVWQCVQLKKTNNTLILENIIFYECSFTHAVVDLKPYLYGLVYGKWGSTGFFYYEIV